MWPFRRGGNAAASGIGDRLGTLATALPVLAEQLDLQHQGTAGVCLRPGAPKRRKQDGALTLAEVELWVTDALVWGGEGAGASFRTAQDSYGYLWVVMKSPDFAGLVSAAGKVAEAAGRKGGRDRLVVAMFPFKHGQQPAFWIFSFSSARFYPFVPLEEPQRDNELELRMAKTMEKALPVDPVLERWRGLWGVPV